MHASHENLLYLGGPDFGGRLLGGLLLGGRLLGGLFLLRGEPMKGCVMKDFVAPFK